MTTHMTRLLAVLAGVLTFVGSAGVAHSAWSGTLEASLTVTVPAAPATPPAAPVASCGDAVSPGPQHRFTWSDTGTSYTVFRSGAEDGTYVAVASTTAPGYTHSGFAPSEAVYFKVKAYYGVVESAYSNVVLLGRRGSSQQTYCERP